MQHDVVFLPAQQAEGTSKPASGMNIVHTLVGPHGAIVFTVHTGWVPDCISAPGNRHNQLQVSENWAAMKPPANCCSVDYYWKFPLQEGHDNSGSLRCPYFDGPVYYSRSYTDAYHFLSAMVHGGTEGLHKALLEEYNKRCLPEPHPRL